MKRRRLTSQGALSRLMQAAVESWARLDYQQYFDLLERAHRLDPANHGLLLDLGSAYGKRYDYAAAERCFEQAFRIAPQRSEAMAMAGVHCRGFGHYAMAKMYFERAIQEKSVSADTYVKLAELYERFRLLQQASDLVDRALELDPAGALALLVKARLERLSGRLIEAESTVRKLLSGTSAETWSTRIRGWYELGAILDQPGRYDEAMAAFVEAKTMILPNAASRISSQREAHLQLKEMETDISVDLLHRWREARAVLGSPRRMALLCGHPRSGTPLLEQVLDAHPEITSAEETSVFFQEVYLPLRRGLPDQAPIVPGLETASLDALREARQAYFSCLERFLGAPAGNRLLLDKNPSLTGLIPAVCRVFPEAKFLVALRDPRDVCLSCFMQPLPLNQVSAMFLKMETTVQEYVSVMGLWRALAPGLPGTARQIRYEDLVTNLESVSRECLEFLGVGWDPRVLRYDQHAREKLVRSPTYADVAKPVFKTAIGRWRNYEKYLQPWVTELEPFVASFGYEL